MNFSRMLVVALLALPLLTAGVGATAATVSPLERVSTERTSSPERTSSTEQTFVVDGRVAEPLTLTVQQLRNFPVQRQKVHFTSGSGREEHRYRGALLADVLAAAKPQFDPAVKNDKLRHAVLVTATDGYQAVVSWGEIDPLFANAQVLLAFEEDQRALERPRLVVPGDDHGGRYVTDISAVSVFRVGG